MDKPIKIRQRPNVVVCTGKMVPSPPGTRGKRMHLVEADARFRRRLMIGALLIVVLTLGILIGRFLLS